VTTKLQDKISERILEKKKAAAAKKEKKEEQEKQQSSADNQTTITIIENRRGPHYRTHPHKDRGERWSGGSRQKGYQTRREAGNGSSVGENFTPHVAVGEDSEE